MGPAAGGTISSADIRRCRKSAAAVGDNDGHGVDHQRGYTALPRWRQEIGSGLY
jgi:hypothetical protein